MLCVMAIPCTYTARWVLLQASGRRHIDKRHTRVSDMASDEEDMLPGASAPSETCF